jgi:hypothetical protein
LFPGCLIRLHEIRVKKTKERALKTAGCPNDPDRPGRSGSEFPQFSDRRSFLADFMAAETFLFVLFFWWLQKKRTGLGKE